LRQTLKKGKFSITMDRAFNTVIRNCARVKRGKEKGTWITTEMIHAYTALHRSGYAHSVEAWSEDRLTGGLYGIALGSALINVCRAERCIKGCLCLSCQPTQRVEIHPH
jgi:leucyl/phenylalanyl-tRNA--protein transferase